MKLEIGIIILTLGVINFTCAQVPLVLTTWSFKNSTQRAWDVLHDNLSSCLDALVVSLSVCEEEQCDGTVGYGGSPDENGETTLDAFIMDGSNMNVGAVAGLRQIKNAIVVARHVLENTKHSLLVGDLATDFAVTMGLKKEPLSTDKSKNLWKTWRNKNCQPNFWMNVVPDPEQTCGPYIPTETGDNENSVYNDKGFSRSKFKFGTGNHDTIGMIIIDKEFKIVAGTSTNGAKYKIPGRVGDSPIPGAGAYADNTVGAAASTGDGDIMMRFLPSFTAVEGLRRGLSAKNAAIDAISRIIKYYPNFVGGIIVARKDGQYSAACHGMKEFPFSVYQIGQTNVTVKTVECI